MAIKIDSIVLSDDIIWTDRDVSAQVAQTVKKTLQGKPVIVAQQLSGGREITLEATLTTGWMLRSVWDALIALANVAGAVYTFDYQGELYQVVFSNQQPPAVAYTPLVYRNSQQDTDYCFGHIKLLTL